MPSAKPYGLLWRRLQRRSRQRPHGRDVSRESGLQVLPSGRVRRTVASVVQSGSGSPGGTEPRALAAAASGLSAGAGHSDGHLAGRAVLWPSGARASAVGGAHASKELLPWRARGAAGVGRCGAAVGRALSPCFGSSRSGLRGTHRPGRGAEVLRRHACAAPAAQLSALPLTDPLAFLQAASLSREEGCPRRLP